MEIIPKEERTLCGVLHIVVSDSRHHDEHSPDIQLEEAVNLCEALPLDIELQQIVKVNKVSPRTFLGKGKVEEIATIIHEKQIELLVVNCSLSPTQQRNLEVALKIKVIDRTGLILEIFADRARTHAGRLQVEMALLRYQSNRLVRTWTHLERQRGGLGKTGGPGERQIELDRRMIRDKIDKIRKELEDVEKTRALHRKARIKSGLPVIALVGYTNAGKSTLFNKISGSDAFVRDMLFATLDPLMRKVKLRSGREVIISDTVGFVSDLPHELVTSFHATLEEVVHADLLLHVHDAASKEGEMQAKDVHKVLESIGAASVPCIEVYNKQDIAEETSLDWQDFDGIGVSALTGQGVDALEDKIEAFFAGNERDFNFVIPVADGKRIAWLHAHGDVKEMNLEAEEYHIKVLLSEEDAALFASNL